MCTVAIIVLHEIYGINRHIIKVCEEYSKYGIDIIAPNLLAGREPFSYDQEEIAYSYFMNTIGFERSFSQVKDILFNVRANYQEVYVLGYSIGATLAWLCSETGLCDLTIGFYGSRIRDYLLIKPKCPSLLFFPTTEKSFNVEKLILSLNEFENVQVKKMPGQHGFADPFSNNYNKRSSSRACVATRLFIKKHETVSA
ncbi:dienelactone hydrolase family protein [Sporomusa sp.]|uniref:dienelactone hydrolase family protein n=1 Tax=Sporomusa sp. TaxID=2078658 RepID=UPI002CEBBB2F|nr:dienelactone hydrolase family protein [Sporomusa sp.]HWR42261.1 dienelactone hydrolase family protein [Sporomusa sp.]